MSGLINKNSALVTMSLSRSSIISGFTRALNRGWVERKTLDMLYISSLLLLVGIAVIAAGCCITLGKRRLKRLGTKIIAIASILSLMPLLLLTRVYDQFSRTANPDRIEPMFAKGFWVFLGLLALTFLLGLINTITLPKPVPQDRYEMEAKYRLFLMMLPFVILCFVFSYLPLWGWRYAFFDYKPGSGLTRENFVGFKWFTYLFENPATSADILRVIRNTLAMSGLGIITSWLPMAFAIFLLEISAGKFRRIVQTFSTIPNFISWVLVYSFAFALFSTEGFVNAVLGDLGIIEKGTNYLMSSEHIWLKMWAWGTWKSLGWNAIIYTAGAASIDQQLYEAATIDGAGRFKRMWYITVPGLMPTFFVLLLLSIAGILSNGMDQYFVFKNAANKDTIEVLDLYVYVLGLGSGGSGNIPLATVVGMLKSLISITLLFGANRVSKSFRGESII
ncbi:ABC transporter permease [Clostridium thermosuccinogenes]|uniref:ABC transporter permease n=2 Tax=Clostridium thermosuccinogenes TaxID=84032 RepID=A0A2K2FC37_9CLOT|nr:ABC transporter permease [Pseudoclostridium thermosuccinogenes]PNT96346.1 ABC transporter permease [Pseudoclostridium thermosuccinogenes]PNT97533.1 ABC transporter permease [Pseudoclostridium thermosuccinogenes]